MNKKLLLNQNRELFDKLQLSNLNCKRLREENQMLNEKLLILTNKINELENQRFNQNEVTSPKETLEAAPQEIEETDEEVFEEEIVLSNEIEYGSKIIGEIVMNAALSSNRLGEMGKTNTKELLNLILGRTEVAKAEILNIVSSNMSFAGKVQSIDSVANEANEYFQSVLEQ